jgi:autotransporter-associated beta strand protein
LNLVTNTAGFTTSTLTVSGNGGTFAGQIADSTFGFTALTVASGTETLSANNAYSGVTTVTGGALIVSGSLSGSTNGFTSVSVTGGTLGGTGMIAEGGGSNLTVSSGGTLAPGLSANGLTVDLGSGGGSASLKLQAGSTFQLTINNSNAGTSGSAALSDYSKLTLGSGVSATLAGAVSLNQGTVNSGDLFTVLILNGQQVSGTFTNSTLVSGDTYSIAINGQYWLINYDYDGSLGETASGISASTFEGITGGDEVALLAEVPEPGTWAMMLAGVGMLTVLQRRRRRI